MKKTDIALIILISGISIGLSWFLAGKIFGNPNNDVKNISYIDPISATLDQPDVETFNPKAIDPVVEVIIGQCKTGEIWSEKDQKCIEDRSSENTENIDENAVDENGDNSDVNNSEESE